MKKKYNRFKKINKNFRETITPNAFGSLEKFGNIGKIGGYFGNKIIKKPMHKLNRNLTRLYYNPKFDSPFKGSILYTLFTFLSYSFLCCVISLLVLLIL